MAVSRCCVYFQRDKIWVSPRLLKRVMNDGFALRELAIMRHLEAGKFKPEIAAGLDMSEPVLERHLMFLMAKLGATSFDTLRELASRRATRTA